jgi:hypothetical protein
MKRNPKVLIGVVTASQKDYCAGAFTEQLKSFNYDNYEVFIVDNSEDEKHIRNFEGFDVEHISRFKQNGNYKKPNVMLTECQNRIRDKFLEGDYEYLFMLESDCFINRDIIAWALSHESPVYSVSYLIKVDRYPVPSMCVQYLHVLRHEGIDKQYSNSLMLPPEVTIPAECRTITDFRIDNNMILSHTGIGCTFIRRDVVEKVKFRIDRANDLATGNMTFSDTFFWTDMLANRVEALLDNRLIVNHIKNW